MNKSLIRSSITLGVLLLLSMDAMAQTEVTNLNNHKVESASSMSQTLGSNMQLSHTLAFASQKQIANDSGVCLGCIGQV